MDDRTEIAARVMAALLADGYSAEDAADEAVERTDALLDALAEPTLDDNDPTYDQFLPNGYRWLEVGEEIIQGDRVVRNGLDDDAYRRWGGEQCRVEKFICRKVEEPSKALVVKVPPAYPFPGNYAQIRWNTCCLAHREALDKAGVKWQIDLGSHWLSMAEEGK